MGKWTREYTDDVLGHKMRELICASIERVRHDDGPSITYDVFVQELNQGDMFCSKMMDLLVFEIADRRYRLRHSDRRHICDRTVAGLHSLGSTSRVSKEYSYAREYRRASAHASNNSNNVSFMNTESGHLLSDEDEDTMDPLLASVDGARLGTELYDSYANQFSFPLGSHSNMSRLFARPSPPPDESTSDEQPVNVVPRNAHSGAIRNMRLGSSNPGGVGGSAELIRRPSVRRRDFDWAQRRRNYARTSGVLVDHSSGHPASPGNEVPSFWGEPSDRGSSSVPPAFLSRRSQRRSVNSAGAGTELTGDTYASSSRLRPFSSSFASTGLMPRLRRGGLQPPETFIFGSGTETSVSASNGILQEDPIPGLDIMDRLTPPPAVWSTTSEPIGLPTPRSASPEDTRRSPTG